MTATPQTDSRLLDATHTVLEVCDTDHIDFNKANAFILSTYALGSAPHGNDNADYKLQWQRAGGSFADVGADTEIAWGDSTDFTPNITDENTSVTTDANCLTATNHGQNVGNNALAGAMSAPNGIGHYQWGLKFGSGALDEQEYEFQLVNTTDTLSAICSVSITTAAAGAGWTGTIDGITNPSAVDGIVVANINNIDGV